VRVFAHGASEPVESNRTEAGRAANRRVEIVIGS
jgi:flagellar motor protein MotB